MSKDEEVTNKSRTKVSLVLNGIVALGISVLTLPFGLQGILHMYAAPFGTDPDGGDKALAVSLFAGVIGLLAANYLIRTIKTWRKTSQQE